MNIKKEIEAQKKKKDALEARANVAEKKIEELNSKLENVCSDCSCLICITCGLHSLSCYDIALQHTDSSF